MEMDGDEDKRVGVVADASVAQDGRKKGVDDAGGDGGHDQRVLVHNHRIGDPPGDPRVEARVVRIGHHPAQEGQADDDQPQEGGWQHSGQGVVHDHQHQRAPKAKHGPDGAALHACLALHAGVDRVKALGEAVHSSGAFRRGVVSPPRSCQVGRGCGLANAGVRSVSDPPGF